MRVRDAGHVVLTIGRPVVFCLVPGLGLLKALSVRLPVSQCPDDLKHQDLLLRVVHVNLILHRVRKVFLVKRVSAQYGYVVITFHEGKDSTPPGARGASFPRGYMT